MKTNEDKAESWKKTINKSYTWGSLQLGVGM